MTQLIIFKNLDGSCGVIYPTPKSLLTNTIEQIAQKDVPVGLSYRIASTDALPNNRDFRNAWTDDNPTHTVDVDMGKARDIHMSNIRQAREKKFIELGFPHKLNPELEEAIISTETRAQLQVLRDIPQNLDLDTAATPDELKAIWPIELIDIKKEY